MYWRVQRAVVKGVGPGKWITLGTVDSETQGEARAFAEWEWGLSGTDIVSVTAVIEEGHAQYLYNAVKEFLAEIEGGIPYPETTATEWMEEAIGLIEKLPEGREKGAMRV